MTILRFTDWLDKEYGDYRHWPEDDEDGTIWGRYMSYVSFKDKILSINFGKVK